MTTDPATDNASHAPPLADRLRLRRKELGLTLQQVADLSGLSVGFISQIERGITAPSLSSLSTVSEVLAMHVSEFLAPPSGASPRTKQDERREFAISDGPLTYERLSSTFPGSTLNSVIIHEPPGYRSEPSRHTGEEIFYVIDGEITVELEGEATILTAGDSLHFDSMRLHSGWNHTTAPTKILHTCTMDVFGDKTRPSIHHGARPKRPGTTGRNPRPEDLDKKNRGES